MRFQDFLVVTFVWFLIVLEGLSFIIFFASNLFNHNFGIFMLLIPLWMLIVTLLCISYYKSTFSEPGTPNHLTNMNYSEELEELKVNSRREVEEKKKRRRNRIAGQIDQKEIDSLNEISYCFKCDVVKERRVHHCSICKKCIIRMDHHCPWVGNCVGKYNHKYFLLFLAYATIGLLIISLSITVDYLLGGFYADLLPNEGWVISLYINCISSFFLALAIGFLFVTQMMTAVKNITTLESFTQGISERNPWTHGTAMYNLKEIMGETSWLLPTNPFPDSPKHTSSSLQQVVIL